MDFETLKNQNLLTISPSGYVCIKPINQFDFTTYPIDKNDYILITPEEYIGLIERTHIFNEQLTGVIEYIIPKNEENALTNEE